MRIATQRIPTGFHNSAKGCPAQSGTTLGHVAKNPLNPEAGCIISTAWGTPICNLQSAICNLQSAICNLQSAICNLQSAICNLQSEICNLKSQILQLPNSYEKPTPICILSALSAFFAVNLSASTITGNLLNTSGTAYATNILFAPLSTPLTSGSSIIASTPTNILAAVNGDFAVTLKQGNYLATIGNLRRDSVLISVPDDANTYNINSLITSALTFSYTFSPLNEQRVNKGQPDGYVGLAGSLMTPSGLTASNLTLVGTTTFNPALGVVPIGGIVAWDKSLTGVPALPSNFVECNGQTISDAASPLNGRTIRNLNGGNPFLPGNTTSGTSAGAAAHTHTFTGSTDVEDGDASAGSSGTPVTVPGLGHTHAFSGTTASATSLPPYTDMVWVMRIK